MKLPEPICNVGCYPISNSEILLYGGLDKDAREVSSGRVMICIQDAHSFLEEQVSLTIKDCFPNTALVQTDTRKAGSIFVMGKQGVHRLDLSDPTKRRFFLEFQPELP